MPPSYRRRKKLVPYRCDTCGVRDCRRKWKVTCWVSCGNWKPELLPLDDVVKERES